MRAVVSRVVWARVVADGELTGEIGAGLLVLVGVTHGDTEADAAWLAAISHLAHVLSTVKKVEGVYDAFRVVPHAGNGAGER